MPAASQDGSHGPRLLARVEGITFVDGTSADVELFTSPTEADHRRTFAAMVFLMDGAGDLAVVHSARRGEWGAPGGWREPGESVRENATREVEEETGIRLDPGRLTAVGYEVFHPHGSGGLWRAAGQDVLQSFRAELPDVAPLLLSAATDGTSGHEWVTAAEFAHRCDQLFWWPLAETVIRTAGPARG